MQMTTIPRTLVRTWLSGVRLPLTAVEAVTRHGGADDAGWAPTLAFETFKAKSVAGAVLRDPSLVEESRLQTAKVRQLKQAIELEAEAETKRAEADARLEQKREEAEQRRTEVERQAAQREQALQQQKAAAERQVQEQARAREEAARKAEQVRQKSLTVAERDAKATRLAEESKALAKRRQAVSAAGTALAVEETLEQKKAARKNS
jgi:colicin import membrane protein